MQKRRNGYVYIVSSPKFPGCYKIGFSENVEVRKRFISQSINREVREHFRIYLRNAFPVEQWLHRAYSGIQESQTGSGRTEYFRPSMSPVVPIIGVFLVIYYMKEVAVYINPMYLLVGILAFCFGMRGASFVFQVAALLVFVRMLELLQTAFILAIILFFLWGVLVWN